MTTDRNGEPLAGGNKILIPAEVVRVGAGIVEFVVEGDTGRGQYQVRADLVVKAVPAKPFAANAEASSAPELASPAASPPAAAPAPAAPPPASNSPPAAA